MEKVPFVIILLAFFCLFVDPLIKIIRFVIKQKRAFKMYLQDFKIDLHFVQATRFREQDDEIQEGDCKLELNPKKFFIKQNDLVIENNLDNIYRIEFFDNEGYTYFKIVMATHIEYIFTASKNNESSIRFMIATLSTFFKHYGIKIENNSGIV